MLYKASVELLLPIYCQIIWSSYVYLKNILRKIYPLFKCSKINYLEKIVEAREISREKVREILVLSEPMNIIGFPTHLSNDKESFIVADDGSHAYNPQQPSTSI